jgi:hypothetical protein
MEQKPALMSKSHMISATERAAGRIEDLAKLHDEIKYDLRHTERMAELECKACFYFSRIGGAACTSRPCMSCGTNQLYGSTNTDVLCKECAQRGDLCRHCGGDREMRTRRRKWPVAYSERGE